MFRLFAVLSVLIMTCFGGNSLWGQQHAFTVDNSITLVDANIAPYDKVLPGDTVLFETGQRKLLRIQNFKGQKDHPIIFMNHNGPLLIDTDHYYGISILNCRYFRMTGTGDVADFYGIRISRVADGAGLSIGGLSSDFEIDHVSIENCHSVGIFAKTDPDCSLFSTRGNFTQYNSIIHDNYIGHVGTEGLYIGSTQYFGQKVTCNGADTLLMPSLLEGVKVYKNIIEYSGWDGIQVSSAAKDCQVADNIVLYDSREEAYGQMSGIIIGGGSHCDCYNNFVSQGNGQGIEIFGLAGQKVYNNIIVDAGKNFFPADHKRMVHGIFVTDISAEADSSFSIVFNTIINPKSDGIRFASSVTKNNLIASNLIVNPGNFNLYENGTTSFKGKDAYIMFPNGASQAVVEHNFLTRNINDAKISESDFIPLRGSSLIDSAYSNNLGIDFDFRHHSRVFGASADIGALEYDEEFLYVTTLNNSEAKEFRLFPNPVQSTLGIRFHSTGLSVSELDIYNLQGKLVLQKQEPPSTSQEKEIYIQVGGLQPGIYLYNLNTDGRTSSGRFIKL